MAFSRNSFGKLVDAETARMLDKAGTSSKGMVSGQMLSNLPSIIQKWLLNSGIVGREPVHSVYLEQDLKMLLKPSQKKWANAKAKQYFTIEPPAFNWSVRMKMNPLMPVVGRDKFENGQGEMTIKLFSRFALADAKNNEKLNQATLQRYLAETVWFPSAALSPYITWQKVDVNSAKATMEYCGTKGSGVFHFDENGTFKKFVALRYKDVNDATPTEWVVTAIKTELRNGIKIPVVLKADWKLDSSYWTWLKLKITAIDYNVKGLPEWRIRSVDVR